MRFGSAQLSVLAMASIVAACGGRAARDSSSLGGSGGAGASSGGSITTAGSSGSSSAGRGGSGEGGSAGASGGAGASGSAGASGGAGASGASGSAGASADGGLGGSAGASGSGGTGGSSMLPDVTALLGDYDLFVAEPPEVEGCTPDWYEPRLNLGIIQTEADELYAEAFADFQWSMSVDPEAPFLSETALVLPASRNWDDALLAPELTLDLLAQGFSGFGVAELPYSCGDGPPTTRVVAVTLLPDTTPPKLLLEPTWPRLGPAFAFTRFGFRFSEPVILPSGDYLTWFEEPSDGATVAELWDPDTGEAFATGFRWSLAGPVAVANFAEPELAELRNVSVRVVETVRDRAGNDVVALGHVYQILPAAAFTTQIDFDDGPVVGIHGNATYYAQPGPDAPCEQGGCLVLSGPVPICGDPAMPTSLLAVRFPEPWDYGLDIRYRVWASTQFVAPISVIFASACQGEYSANLSALAVPDGPFTHAGPWTDDNIGPCGGPDNENGFVISLGCVQGPELPEVRVVIESVARSEPP